MLMPIGVTVTIRPQPVPGRAPVMRLEFDAAALNPPADRAPRTAYMVVSGLRLEGAKQRALWVEFCAGPPGSGTSEAKVLEYIVSALRDEGFEADFRYV